MKSWSPGSLLVISFRIKNIFYYNNTYKMISSLNLLPSVLVMWKQRSRRRRKKGRKQHVMWATSIPERIWKANPFPLWRLLSKQDLKTRPEPFLTRDLDSIAHHFLPLLLLSFWVYFHLEGERKIFLCKQNLRWWETQKYLETQSIR